MFRSTSLLRSTLAVAVGLGTAALIAGCSAPAVVVESATPKPTETDFASIGGDSTPEPIDTTDTVDPGTVQTDNGYTFVVDDQSVLGLQVPSTWTDTNGTGFSTDDGAQWAALSASTDLNAYYTTWTTSGVESGVTPMSGEVTDESLLGFLDQTVASVYAKDCTPSDQDTSYEDELYVGYVSYFDDCGGVGTSAFALAVVNKDFTHVLYVRGQLTSDEDLQAVYTAITNSFQSNL